MKQLLLSISATLFLLCISHTVTAQTFRPGFIVTAEGDTLHGLIKYRENDRNYKSCVFKKTQGSDVEEYYPDDIKAYSIKNNALFESKALVDINGNSIKTFAEVLVHGSLSLYHYKDLLFLEKDKGDLKLLKIETEESSIDGRATLTTFTQHLALLNSLTFDCPVPEAVMMKVQKKLSVPRVVEIVETYNNCKRPNSSISYREDKPWLAVEKGILAGSHSTSLIFRAGSYSINSVDFPTAYNVIIGGHLNITSPRKSERISVHLEGLYSQENHVGYIELNSPLILYRDDYKVDVKRFSVVSMARYSFASNNTVSPYLGIGLSSNAILSGNAERRVESETFINGLRQFETTVLRTKLNKEFYASATAAIGVSYRIKGKQKMMLQLRYEQGRYIEGNKIEHEYLTSHIENESSIYLTVAYIF